MKKFFLGASVLAIAATSVNAQTGSTPAKTKVVAHKPTATAKPAPVFVLKNSTDSLSYALGMNIANTFDDLSYPALQKAIADVRAAKPTILNEEQANKSIQEKLQANAMKKVDKVKEQGKAFLADNAKRPEVKTLASGLQYEVLRKSDSAVLVSPTLEDTVVTNYKGTLLDGSEFDNSYKRGEPLSLPVGGVIKGWTEALQLMHVGDKWRIYIPSDLAYGDRGAGQAIPGGATLIFEMELLAIKPAAKTK